MVILLLFSFAFDPASDETKTMGGGLLWLCFAFAGALIFNRGFARELPNECLDALLASPIPAASLLVGKAITSFVLLLIVEAVSLYRVRLLLQRAGGGCSRLRCSASIFLEPGASRFWVRYFGALTVNLRLRELMLPVLIYPLLIPLLMAAIEADESCDRQHCTGANGLLWGRVLVVFDIVYTCLAVALAETILVN